MKPTSFSRSHTLTPFVQLNTSKCKACWKCLHQCPQLAIDKVDLPWHKHALIANSGACSGCLKCVRVCEYHAFSKRDMEKEAASRQRKRTIRNFFINNLLVFIGLLMIFTGLTLQMAYHVGGSASHHAENNTLPAQTISYTQMREIDVNKTAMGFTYTQWSIMHKAVIFAFTLLMMYHVYAHWKWYTSVIRKHLIGKHFQVITLSVIFILVAITGLLSWIISLRDGTGSLRLILMEIHDKLAIILTIYMVLHIIGRMKWFTQAFSKL
jgi:ferredoxin